MSRRRQVSRYWRYTACHSPPPVPACLDPAIPSVPPPMRSPSSRWRFTVRSRQRRSPSSSTTPAAATPSPWSVARPTLTRCCRSPSACRWQAPDHRRCVVSCWPRFARGRTKLAGNASGRHRPMDRSQRHHRIERHRVDRVVRRRPGRGRLPARTARRAAAVVNACLPDRYRRARRSVGLSRRPAPRNRRNSSRLDVNDAPATIRSSKYSSGTS